MKKRLFSLMIAATMLLGIVPIVSAATTAKAAQKAVEDEAYLMYADTNWTYQYMGEPVDTGVVATNATVTGPGTYTVGLDFTGTADGFAAGLAFTAIGINNGETDFAGYCIKISSIKVNDEEVTFSTGYTSSDDGIVTRMNIFNEWVTELPADARSVTGDLTDANWVTVDKEAFAEVKTVQVTFSYVLPGSGVDTAYLMYADAAWTYQYWGTPDESGVVATDAAIDGEGNYTVGLDFTGTADGAAADIGFSALGIKFGELTSPGYYIQINSITVNGEEIAFDKGYTSSDDGITTRMNIFNEWVTELPVDARSNTGDTSDSNWSIVDKTLFASVETIEVNFDYIAGEVTDTGTDTGTDETEATIDFDAALDADYNAYFGVQTTSYIFRNAWWDGYGIDTTNWTHLTGWDGDAEVDYGGTFTDAAITGNGTYTVSVALGDMGFGTDKEFNILFVSTDIPSALVTEGYITFSDVYAVFDGGKKCEYTYVDTEGDYASLVLISSYNSDVGADAIAYVMPVDSIALTFSISGLTKDAEQAVAEATATPATKTESDDKGISDGAIVGIVCAAVLVVGGVVVAIVLNKKKSTKK